ncbi:diacylglycerol/lipid kinase family protein [Roseibacillus persicicus]|uniref:diacylglycerol/lipid kinase family protein n=1 Tax=Roseibacillus persicicus TaxID=454148 RepID=UPI00280D171C|nr:diacylglycerol kinase family protein [Roseibacillus persicicus]MDQ8192179.1 diacylglycerol kinase family protein [Roseibacillus persicicus]
MRYQLVINRASGSGILDNQEGQERLVSIFAEVGHEVTVQVVDPPHLDRALTDALASDCDGIIIGGGDGSITSTADRVAQSDKVLGVLPLGTFNLEARDLGISLDPFEAARELATAEVKKIDLLRVNEFPCLCTMVIGFYPIAAKMRKDIHGSAWWRKSLQIPLQMTQIATRCPVLDLTLRTDGQTVRRKTRATAFSPSEYVDEFGLIPRRENLASGKLFTYISEHLTRAQLWKLSLDFLTGRLFSTEGMTVLDCEELTLNAGKRSQIPAMIDGEIVRLQLPCQIRVEPAALSILVPSQP